MAKIKSTLELVMERTRNLTLSDDEKEQQSKEDGKKGFNGLLQKYLDQLLDMSELRKEMSRLREKYPALTDGDMRGVLLEKIDLDTVGGPMTDLLGELFDLQVMGLRQVIRNFQQQRATQAEAQIHKLRTVFKEQFGISGSAITPNPDVDPQWRQELDGLRSKFMNELEREKAALS